MTDRFERKIGEIGGPRSPDPEFRDRLERAIIHESAPEVTPAARWRIDGPRALSSRMRSRIEAAMTRRKRWSLSPLRLIAAAVAVVMLAGTTIVIVDRVGKRGSGGDERPFVAAPTNSPTPGSTPSTPPKAAPSGPSTLRGFKSAGQFLAYVHTEGLKQNGPYGIPGSIFEGGGYSGGPVAAAPGSAPRAPSMALPYEPYSTTNVQEAGVDEPDIVKTDGRRMIVLTHREIGGSVARLFDVRKGARFLDSIGFSEGEASGLFLAGDRVVVLEDRLAAPREARMATHVSARRWTTVTVLSVADPENIMVVSSMHIEGSYVDARLAGGVVRLVVASDALGPSPVSVGKGSPEELEAAEKANERSIRRSIAGDWVPHFVLQRTGRATTTGHVHDWSAISRPPDQAGLGMLTVLTIDPADPAPDNAMSIVGAGNEIYASLGNLYVTSNRWEDTIAARNGQPTGGMVTRIHKLDISDPASTTYLASGEVSGFLLNQFSMSEYAGRLRVATTVESFVGNTDTSESFMTVLSETAGRLVRVGSVGNLGKGERIFSVRFAGRTAYVVTFRQLDPLYVVDLRKPNHPRVRGQLKVPGFSEYLHPLSEALLVGVGRDASRSGVAKGLQLSLFDVSNPASPERIDNLIQGDYGQSGLDRDHHAFLYWEPERLMVVPAVISSDPQGIDFVGAIALTVSPTGEFGDPVRLTHVGRSGVNKDAPPEIQRSLVIGRRLLTISEEGILLSDLGTLDDRAWVPFLS
ncbi:MAG: beta-propeller domain-containing protein [Actinomycetota bacterium]